MFRNIVEGSLGLIFLLLIIKVIMWLTPGMFAGLKAGPVQASDSISTVSAVPSGRPSESNSSAQAYPIDIQSISSMDGAQQ